jgi:hypothetical protein
MYNTDIRAAGEGKSATFDFQGFVRETRDGYQKGVFYKDAMATNGIFKNEEHDGIHVGTDGIVNYNSTFDNHRNKSPADVGEYVVYISVPGKLQRERGCIVKYDSCRSVGEFKNTFGVKQEEVEEAWLEDSSSIEMRLGLKPKKDPLARKKVELIHSEIVRFIEGGGRLEEIADMARDLEDDLVDISAEDFAKRKRLLETNK